MPIDENMKAVINSTGRNLALHLPGFYGKVTFNLQNGVYVNSNVEQSIKADNPKKDVEHGKTMVEL